MDASKAIAFGAFFFFAGNSGASQLFPAVPAELPGGCLLRSAISG